MFCTNCGVRISPATRFCTECGQACASAETVMPAGSQVSEIHSFKDPSAALPASTAEGVCIVFTNLRELKERLDGEFAGLHATLERWMRNGPSRGVSHVMLDAGGNFLRPVAGGDWRAHVEVLREAVDWLAGRSKCVRSVVILGDEQVIPMPCLENPVGMDKDVDSDYPYSSLSTADPWEELGVPVLAVGRLPVGMAAGPAPAAKYLENIMSVNRLIAASEPIGFGAAVWAGASRATLATFSKQPIALAPPMGAKAVASALVAHCGLLYFNLHGSNDDDEPEWFGQSHDRQYPKTVTPGHFRGLSDFNIVGVEACYGGRFAGYGAEGSCLLAALGHRTLGFLGASRIAFGPPEPPRGLADIVIGDFLRGVGGGASLGEALLMARDALAATADNDAHSRLTILEFNLFGDPEFRPFAESIPTLSAAEVMRPPNAEGLEGSAASRLRAQIRAQTDTARRRMGGSIRRIDLAALIGAEIQRSLAKCREVADAHVLRHCPDMLGGTVVEACYSAGDKTHLLKHYFVKARGGPYAGVSLKQDMATANIIDFHQIK